MNLFGRTGGYWMFWTGFVYFWLGIFDIIVYNAVHTVAIQLVWLLFLCMPLVIKPLARFLNMKTLWEN